MANRNQYKAADFIRAIPGSGGIISTIARRVGCDWHTVRRYIDEFSTVAQAYEDECEAVSDLAESKLIESIRGGDLASAKWWLSRKRRSEFADRREITGANGAPVFDIEAARDEILAAITGELAEDESGPEGGDHPEDES